MMTFDKFATTARQLFGAMTLPRIRIAVPALGRRSTVDHAPVAEDRLGRDELMQLFKSDLTAMKTLKSTPAKKNVVPLRPVRVAALAGLNRAA
ncbi:hypothetical protein [Litoreibacter janthinus]|uniref:Uncharacterized protein n=1 Tax=Litoreibacter janthinus TaxID=670154 RepID=A0A1I6HA48_9RHOB|nr:hypothetical protein [Litoreibacter janthinus]SFR51248.1 hypothetical protein SAMN04488002_2724 [Litoreibacter janthinus]